MDTKEFQMLPRTLAYNFYKELIFCNIKASPPL